MAYEDNVRKLAQSLHIPYPLQEESLEVLGIIFPGTKASDSEMLFLRGTEQDRGERLFIQSLLPEAVMVDGDERRLRLTLDHEFRAKAESYFAGLWRPAISTRAITRMKDTDVPFVDVVKK